jgi:hypothetical protein
MKRFLSIFTIFLLALPLTAEAQVDTSQGHVPTRMDSSHVANPHYDFMVRAATTKMSDTFRFGHFRSLYSETRQYDPLGDDVVEQMQELAYRVQTAEKFEERGEALQEYRELVMAHLANMRVIAQALSFSKLDSSFGSPNFFNWLRKGIMRDILAKGDGDTLKTGYSVITLSEETALIGQLGYTVIDTQSANEGAYYYNMHEVEHIKTGEKKTLFVNTSIPMRFVNRKQEEMGKSYKILRQ